MPRSPRTTTGRFPPGVSGNPNGRPPKIRHDSTSVAITAPTPRTVTRHDGYTNPYTGHGTTRDRRIFTHFKGDIVTDVEALDLWETEFIAARIIEAMPEEGYRRGSSLKLEDEELAEAIENWAEDLGVEHAVVDAWEKENALGGAAIFPVIDGAQGDLSTPLRWDAITDVKALHVLEPRELQPVAFHDQLADRSWSMPSMYMFTPITSGIGSSMGTQWIHASRLIVFPGLRVSRRPRPGQQLGWGISRLTRPKQVLADFGLAWGSAATLLHEHDMSWLGMDEFAALMATEDGEEIVRTRLRAMAMAKSTLRAMVGDVKDTFQKVPSSLAGLAEVLNEFKVLMSAASDGMPVSVLMGQSQSGLRSGDDDTLTWYGNVEKRRNKRIKPRHMQALKFLLNAGSGPTGGEEPEVWTLEYPSMWSPSDKEVAETRKTDADRAVALVGAQIVSGDDVAESWYSTDKYPQHGDIKVDWKRRKAQAAIAAQGAGDLSPEDRQAMGRGGEQEDLSDDERAELDTLREEFGTEDGAEPDAEEDNGSDDFEDDDPEGDDREDSWNDDDEQWREDQVAASGHGYNPYRAKDGKFGAGPHAQKPSPAEGHAAAVARAQERVGKARARVETHASKLAAAHSGKQAALAETRSALEKASAASELARAKPTQKNIKAAQVATNKATRAQAKVDKHEAAIAKHTEAHAKATTAHAKAVEGHSKASERLRKSTNPGQAKVASPEAKPLTDKQYESWQARSDGSTKFKNSERSALIDYSGDSYGPINGAFRMGGKPEGHLGDVADRLDSALAKSKCPRDMVVYRGIGSKSIVGHLKPGDVFHDKAFLSTTASSEVAHDSFADGGVVFHITIPKGANAMPMAKEGKYPKEQEILMPRNTRMHINKVENHANGTTIIHAHVLV